jgi:Sulfotransferase domain
LPIHGRYRLPDFLGVGPARTGTTWLHQVLESGADLPANVKETQFFTTYYHKGIDWYAHHFRRARGDRPVGEVCPYFNPPAARKRIKLHLPDCKIICTLRDPVDRLYSHYKMLRRNVWARGTFLELIEARPHLLRGNRYAAHLGEWFDLFGRERVLVLFYEELRGDQQAYINRICSFIGIAPIDLSRIKVAGEGVNSYERAPKNRHLAQNARHVKYFLKDHGFYRTINAIENAGIWDFCVGRGEKFPRLSPEDDARVRPLFVPEVEELEKLLGCDLSGWKTPGAARAHPAPADRQSAAAPAMVAK